MPPLREYRYQSEMADSGTTVVSPATPVAATPLVSVPSYDLPIIAALPLSQLAVTALPRTSLPGVRPFSQSITDFMPAMSPGPPCSGQPVEFAVPFDSA